MNEFMIPINTKSRIPVYEQICRYIKREIQEKRLRAGEKLPSARALAACLSVSRSTVDLSYGQLVSEGYIEAVPCKGYYICDIEGLYYAEKKGAVLDSGRKKELPSFSEQENEKAEYFCDFALNGIAGGGFPYNTWKKLSRKVLSEEDDTLFQLGHPCGERGIREAIAEYLYQARGVHCSYQQIIIGAGNDYLLMLLGTILGRNRRIAMENPTYLTAYYDFLNIGYDIESIGQDTQGMKVEELEQSGADVAYVMPSHQFPMGMVMPLKRRMALLNWAREKEGRYIIEDDYDSEFRYKGKPIPALKGFDSDGCVIYIGTFSKSLAPSIRISYMVLPDKLMNCYMEKKSPFSVTVSKADQRILELFLREGYYERHLNRMRAVYKNKHDMMLKCLRDMSSICTYSGEHAGVHMLLTFVNGVTEKEAAERAKAAGIKVYGLSEYRIRDYEDPENRILLGYACLEEEEIQKAMEILKEVWR